MALKHSLRRPISKIRTQKNVVLAGKEISTLVIADCEKEVSEIRNKSQCEGDGLVT